MLSIAEGDDATPTALDVAGWTRSFERERVIEAIHGGNDVEINGALQQLLTRMSPSDALVRQLAISQRSARQLEAVDRFEAWVRVEREGRKESSRAETARLNRLLRSWFQTVTVTVDEDGVAIRATRPARADGRDAADVAVLVDLREWARSAPMEHREHPRIGSGRAPRSSARLRRGLTSTAAARASLTGGRPAPFTRAHSPYANDSEPGRTRYAKPGSSRRSQCKFRATTRGRSTRCFKRCGTGPRITADHRPGGPGSKPRSIVRAGRLSVTTSGPFGLAWSPPASSRTTRRVVEFPLFGLDKYSSFDLARRASPHVGVNAHVDRARGVHGQVHTRRPGEGPAPA